MAEEKKKARTFGNTRYGRSIREKVTSALNERKNNKCPFCRKDTVKRISSGIWGCPSCKNKFTGRSYSMGESAGKPRKQIVEEIRVAAIEHEKAQETEAA